MIQSLTGSVAISKQCAGNILNSHMDLTNMEFITEIPLSDRAISRPKKYLKTPRSLSWNLSLRVTMRDFTAAESLLAMAISLT
jgi:hypothetical protein